MVKTKEKWLKQRKNEEHGLDFRQELLRHKNELNINARKVKKKVKYCSWAGYG